MYSNRPLFATGADARLFVWTDRAKSALEAVRRGHSVLVVGEHGSGKTTLLHMLEHALREEGAAAAYASLRHTDDAGEAAAGIYQAIVEHGFLEEPVDDLTRAAMGPGDPFAPTQLIRDLRRVRAPLTVFVDDVRATVGHVLFGTLRDELWQLPFAWVVAVGIDEAGGLLSPPADAFFEVRISLSGLEREERDRLLEFRNAYGPDTMAASQIERLAKHGPANPRQLVALAREVAEHTPGRSPQKLIEAIERRRQAAEMVAGRAGAMLVAEIEGLGPVSASDDRLLDRLGWTRPRATDVLNKLEEHGILGSYLEARDGRAGRPRKLYELRPPESFLPPT